MRVLPVGRFVIRSTGVRPEGRKGENEKASIAFDTSLIMCYNLER